MIHQIWICFHILINLKLNAALIKHTILLREADVTYCLCEYEWFYWFLIWNQTCVDSVVCILITKGGKSKNRFTAEFEFDLFLWLTAYNMSENEFPKKVLLFDLFITLNFCVCWTRRFTCFFFSINSFHTYKNSVAPSPILTSDECSLISTRIKVCATVFFIFNWRNFLAMFAFKIN